MRLFALSSCLLLFTFLSPALLAAKDNRPNILLILADDFGRELLPVYGGSSYETPHLDQLSKDGLTFETCYATPLCAPSRVELITSQYSFRSYKTWGEMNHQADTYVRRLRESGYQTIMAGKWHMGGWDQEPPGIVTTGFQRYCSYDYPVVIQECLKRKGNQYWGGQLLQDGVESRLEGYGPDVFSEYIIQEIEARDPNKPFFAYYGMNLMHRPFYPTPDHPEAPKSGEPTPRDWMGPRGSAENFPTMVNYADRIIGRLRAALERMGLSENTLVIFTADNGTDCVGEAKGIESAYQGRMVSGGKYFPIERGASVPLICSWPKGIKAGTKSNVLSDFPDLGITLCELAGAEPVADSDGRSLLPVFKGGQPKPKAFVYTWGNFERSSKRYKDPANNLDYLLDVVRSPRWKLYSDGRLFDLKQDPFEEHPLSLDEDSPAAEKARAALIEYREQLRASQPKLW
ncbi:Choline-sulfatase [Planctomycetales bacterium 10988]|nr:Choline-sulfatase [Planctomycetales bacterium 10988]